MQWKGELLECRDENNVKEIVDFNKQLQVQCTSMPLKNMNFAPK